MFRNYLKTAIRNLLREKANTTINIAGLTLGITCSLVLFLLVRHMSSYDNFHTNRERIYRVVTESEGHGGKFNTPGVPTVLPDAFKDEFREVDELIFISNQQNVLIKVPQKKGDAKKFNEENGVAFTQPGFFKIFDRKIVSGNADKGLDDPNEAIISQSLAKKYFGTDDVLGEVVKLDTNEYKVTAVMEDFPSNTDLPFNLLLSYNTIKAERDKAGWRSINSDDQCYFTLKANEKILSIEKGIPQFVSKYLGKENYSKETFVMQPLKEMHFDDRYGTYSNSSVPREMIIALSVIALFLIVTACINFINLATAEAVKRSKEVGIRKTLGSSRAQLVGQFLGETTIITIIAMLIAISLAQLSLSFLNAFMDVKLAMNFGSDAMLWLFIIGVTVVVSLLSGLYPSMVISGYRPVLALKNQISNRSTSGFMLRKGLVVLQFVISQFLIIGTIVLIRQMDYFQKKDLGFRQDAIVLLPVPKSPNISAEADNLKRRTFREEVVSLAGVEAASLNAAPPSSGHVSGTGFIFEGEADSERKDTQVKQADGNYIDLFEIKLLAGRNLSDLDTTNGYLVNEALVKVSGYKDPQDIVGKKIRMWGKTFPIVGVVRDFNTVSLHEKIEPTILMNRMVGCDEMSVKINASKYEDVIKEVQQKWEAAFPEDIFQYQFLDENIREFYEGEQKMSTLLGVFTTIAIFIGCLGLFGLASFMANQKTKEVGVRKALGASVESIVYLFTKEYIKLIAIGFALAAPLAWFVMNTWLDEFEYKITLGPWIFVIGFATTLLIALMTVGYKSLRAAIINPVDSLRYE
jgi:putative ABC transport system permease protein